MIIIVVSTHDSGRARASKNSSRQGEEQQPVVVNDNYAASLL